MRAAKNTIARRAERRDGDGSDGSGGGGGGGGGGSGGSGGSGGGGCCSGGEEEVEDDEECLAMLRLLFAHTRDRERLANSMIAAPIDAAVPAAASAAAAATAAASAAAAAAAAAASAAAAPAPAGPIGGGGGEEEHEQEQETSTAAAATATAAAAISNDNNSSSNEDDDPNGGGRAARRAAAEERRRLESSDPFHGLTVITQAACGGMREVIQLLLDNGADPTVVSASNMDAESAAAQFGHVHVARWMREEKGKRRRELARLAKQKEQEEEEDGEEEEEEEKEEEEEEEDASSGSTSPNTATTERQRHASRLQLEHRRWKRRFLKRRRSLALVLGCIPTPMFVHPSEIDSVRTGIAALNFREGAGARALLTLSDQGLDFAVSSLIHRPVGYSLEGIVTPLSVSRQDVGSGRKESRNSNPRTQTKRQMWRTTLRHFTPAREEIIAFSTSIADADVRSRRRQKLRNEREAARAAAGVEAASLAFARQSRLSWSRLVDMYQVDDE